jgi:hypothetical protein
MSDPDFSAISQPSHSRRRFFLAGGVAVTTVVGAAAIGTPSAAAVEPYASLDENGKVPIEQLPDRVLSRNGGRPVGEGTLVFNVNDFRAELSTSLSKAERDTQAWEAALLAAKTAQGGAGNRYAVVTAPGGAFEIIRTLIWNLRVSIEGHCELTSLVPNAVGGQPQYLWKTEADDQTIGYWVTRQHASSFSHMVCAGSNTARSHGIRIEPTDLSDPLADRRAAYVTFRNTTWRNFDNAVVLGRHSYMVGFHASSIQGNNVGVRAEAPAAGQEAGWNSGEKFAFEDCDLTSNSVSAFSIDYDQAMHFTNCSFDQFGDNNATAGVIARGQAYLTNCHLEMWVPNSSPASQVVKTGQPWFDLTEFGAHLQLTDCRILVRARDGVTGAADTGLIRFSSTAPAKAQRALIRGGHLHGNAPTLKWIATGVGRLTISDTSTFSGSQLRPHSNQADTLLRDGVAGLTKLFDDWMVVSTGADTIAPGAFPGFGSGPDGRAFKLLHKTIGTASNVYLFVPIRPGARILATFDWAVLDSSSVAKAYIGYSTGRRIDGSGEWEGAHSMSRSVAPAKWGSVTMIEKFTKPAPAWAAYVILRIDITQVASNAAVYVKNVRLSEY